MVLVAHEQPPRISQLLPTVKCSSCSQPVPLANLGDHVCPPLPRFDERPPPSARDLNRKSSNASTTVPLDRDRPQLQLPGAPTPDRVSTPARDAIPPALQRVRTPSNASRLATGSPARAAFPIPFADSAAYPVPGRGSTASSRRDNPPLTQQPWAPPRSPSANSASSNATPPPSIRPHPSLERVRTSSTVSSRPSLDKSHPSLDKLRPSLDVQRPSVDSRHPPMEQIPPALPGPPFARLPRTAAPTSTPDSVPFPSPAAVLPPPMSARQPPPPPLSLAYSHAHGMDREIDTKIGGEAGMAGVGRRGFAAAARAAMLSASLSSSHQPPHITPLGDGHRANMPQYLDTFGHVLRAAMTPPLSPNSAQTLSPVSPSPVSPVSLRNITPTNGQYHNIPSPHDAAFRQSPVPASTDKTLPHPFSPHVRIASPSRSPSPIPNPFERRVSGETITQSPMPSVNMSLPFLDVLRTDLDPGNDSDDESVYTTHTDLKKDENVPSSPSGDSEVGLAYAHDSDEDTPVVMPLRKSSLNQGVNKVKFPTSPSPDRKHPSGPSRQISSGSLRSTTSASSAATVFAGSVRSRSASAATQSTAKSLGALERAMETLIEEGASVSVLASGSVLASIGGSAPGRGSGKPSRSNTVPGPASPEQKPPKLPTRSHTSPSHPHVHSERVGLTGEVVRIRNRGSTKRKDRICEGCESKIEDGRWIQMDGGNVLCERCWKNMYLPKCRRCNLPIEKQAVSSRDGQLKGKYHKECFNCHTCQKPFPDKEFYVFDGKPFCAYHYHEANNSLCRAPSCGQPIEGPCAVTHLGKRYHPEHLLCEFDDACKERLEEYWEVDGQMLCERHAALISNRDGGWARGNDASGGAQMKRAPGTDEGRMMKRMTRFIDLGAGGDDDLDIR